MSDKAIFDVTEAQRFANMLDEESKDLAGQTGAISATLLGLHATWKDAKFDEFERLFDEATAHLKRFTEHAGRYSQYLRKKADVAKRYLDRRY